ETTAQGGSNETQSANGADHLRDEELSKYVSFNATAAREARRSTPQDRTSLLQTLDRVRVRGGPGESPRRGAQVVPLENSAGVASSSSGRTLSPRGFAAGDMTPGGELYLSG